MLLGKRPRIGDDELLRLFAELGSLTATAHAADYYGTDWVRKRLRRLGVPPCKPGRPRKEVG